MKMAGFSIRENEFPGVKQAQSWSALVEGWKAELASLATGFAQGSAHVDPKRGLATCRNCDLQPLCRVHERLSALAEDGEERGVRLGGTSRFGQVLRDEIVHRGEDLGDVHARVRAWTGSRPRRARPRA